MSTLRQAAEMALEALEYGQHTLKQVSENQWESRGQLAVQALRAALAEPQHEPQPLTEEEIDSIWDSEKAFADIYAIARVIERAHGIT